MTGLYERERVKLETLELVGSKIISLMREGIEVPSELIDWVQGKINWQGELLGKLPKK